MNIEATFVRSAAGAADFPRDGLAEIALVGRSNVGKSSLINALVRHRVARTSAAPGKTRLANIYRVRRASTDLYLVDLPGYGYARGRASAAAEFEKLTAAYFRPDRHDTQARRERPAPPADVAALLVVDARHPGLESDREAWAWMRGAARDAAIVVTKVDKLSRAQRLRAIGEYEAVFEHPVTVVSAVTGEGLDQLWILIDKLANNPNPRSRSLAKRTAATAPRARIPPKK